MTERRTDMMTLSVAMRKLREKHMQDNPDCPYGDQPHYVPPSAGIAGFYACQPPDND